MSNLINKVKEAVHSDKKDNVATDNPKSNNAGPHGSNMANKVDPRVDSDRDNYNTPGVGGGYGAGGATGGVGGHHQGGAYNDPNVGSGPGGSYGGHGNQSGTAGPHSSNMANRADPRVDSDMDNSRTMGGNNAGYGNTGGIGGTHGGVGGAGYGGPGNTQSSHGGPHSSNMANRADPRVDSDMDGSRNFGAAGAGGQGYGGQPGYGGPGHHQSSNAGPHSSNMANKADPRVDSDMDGGRHAGLGTSGAGHASHTGYDQGGPGGYNAGQGGAGGYGSSATPGSGDAAKTAGPHNSNLMNKLDPRVDSDMDGSKTYGGNQTHR